MQTVCALKNEKGFRDEILIVVDLDYTIINSNTTFDFLKFVAARKYSIFSKILEPAIFLNKILKKDIYKTLLVLICIKGKTKKLLQTYSRMYYDQAKEKGYINETLIKHLRNVRQKTLLLTASLDFIAENFKDLGFNAVIGSRTLYENGRFKGFIDLYGKKHKILQSLSRHYRSIIVIEDLPEKEYSTIPNVKVVKVIKNEYSR